MNPVPGQHDQNVYSMLRNASKHFGSSGAMFAPDFENMSHRELFFGVNNLANFLSSEPNSTASSRVRYAIVFPNGPEMSLVLLASCIAGIAVPLNAAYEKAEYLEYFSRARVDILVVGPSVGDAAILAAGQLGIPVLSLTDKIFKNLRCVETKRQFIKPKPDDLAIVLLTSGTTGRSKLVPLTHRNLWIGASDVSRSLDLSPDDRVLSMWEQAHIGGVVDLLLAPLISGGSIYSAGGFDAKLFFEILPVAKPTWFQGVPTTLHELHRYAINSAINIQKSQLRFLRSVAAALPLDWMADLENLFEVPVIRTFGMTEASPLISSTRLPPHPGKSNSVGISCGTSVAIFGTSTNRLTAGEVGEVAIMGGNVFSGYEDDESANNNSFRDGWFITGDLGYLDADQVLFLTGRTKDLINRGGEKISPAEVETTALSHPDIEQAATFGIPHRTLGETVGIAVVLQNGLAMTAGDLRSFMAGRLAEFKIPSQTIFLEKLPTSPMGKVLRNDILEIYIAEISTNSRLSEPLNELEAVLTQLWAEELDLPSVGIDDNFSDIGGDSLSSTRIILATEIALGVKMPANLTTINDTVRIMAAQLAGIEKTSSTKKSAVKKRIRKGAILTGVTNIMLGSSPLPENLLFDCKRELDFDIARHTSENLSTPKELETLLYPNRGDACSDWIRSPIVTYRISRKRRIMKTDIARALADAIEPMSWTRKVVGDNADLYFAKGKNSAEKVLIVGFSSRAMRLTTPTIHILCAIDPTKFDLLLLRDPSRRHYLNGILGFGTTVQSAAPRIAEYAAENQYRQVVVLGTSSGAIPAICTAIYNRWPRVLACGADRPSSHPHLQPFLVECAQDMQATPLTTVKLAYSGGNARDSRAANEIGKIIRSTQLFPDDRFVEHPLLHKLQLRRELSAFLKEHLTD